MNTYIYIYIYIYIFIFNSDFQFFKVVTQVYISPAVYVSSRYSTASLTLVFPGGFFRLINHFGIVVSHCLFYIVLITSEIITFYIFIGHLSLWNVCLNPSSVFLLGYLFLIDLWELFIYSSPLLDIRMANTSCYSVECLFIFFTVYLLRNRSSYS